jgi:hypothetical protein
MTPGFWTLPEFLIERFPAMQPEVEEKVRSYSEWGTRPFAHLFLEPFLLRELIDAAASGDAARIAVAYETLDELLQATDEDLAGATLFCTIDVITNSPALVESTLPHMRPIARDWTNRLLEQTRRKRSRPAPRRRTSATARARLLRFYVARRDWLRRVAAIPAKP